MIAARAKRSRRGSTSVQILVILVPVFFGFIGFAIDLGRMYLIRGELQSAANAMALAAASKLIGTDASLTNATTASLSAIASDQYSNKYNFGSVVIGQGSGQLVSAQPEPTYYADAASATGEGEGGSSESDASTSRHVRVDITADAPLIFWGLLPGGQERRTPIAVRAAAGISAPLCTACGIESIVIAPLVPEDDENYGFSRDEQYTFGYLCNGLNPPSGFQGATQRIPYLLLNRYNEEASVLSGETTQAFRIGAGGLPGSTNPLRACVAVNGAETSWLNAQPQACQPGSVAPPVQAFACGIYSRFDTALPENCAAIPDADTITSAYSADQPATDADTWGGYTGNMRRVITVAIVDALAPGTATMNVLGFRQFLLQPNPGSNTSSPADNNARFVARYIGSPVPLRQGSFSGCTIRFGPGKVVLHR